MFPIKNARFFMKSELDHNQQHFQTYSLFNLDRNLRTL